MLLTLCTALSPLVVPQAPDTPSAHLSVAVRDLGHEDTARRLEGAIRAHRSSEIPGVRVPGFGRTLRRVGREAPNLVIETFGEVSPDANPLEPFDLARDLWGWSGSWRRVPKRVDPEAFRALLQEAWRDINSAIGTGRNPNDVASHLISTREALRSQQAAFLANTSLWEGTRVDGASQNAIERLSAVDQVELLQIARWIVAGAFRLSAPEIQRELRGLEPTDSRIVLDSVRGGVVYETETSFGRFVVGGYGPNRYNCDEVDVIVDLGGDDTYEGRAGGAGEHRRLAIVIDLEGDDHYECLDGGLGAGILGLGILLDLSGKDTYRAQARAAGLGIGGVGVFMDMGGDDTLELGHDGGGVGFGGTGIFVDLRGDDHHTIGSGGFGYGLSGGLGLFLDGSGNDVRTVGGELVDEESADQRLALALGAGLGLYQPLDGGLGAFCDLDGDDKYNVRGGVAVGAAMLGSSGIFYDRRGEDVYTAGPYSLGAAFDCSVGLMVDAEGDDRTVAGAWSHGAARAGSLAVCLDVAGDDIRAAQAPAFGVAEVMAWGAYLDLAGKDNLVSSAGPERLLFGAGDGTRHDEGDGLGVFLHLGGAVDNYNDYAVEPKPRDAEADVVLAGSRGKRVIRLLADR